MLIPPRVARSSSPTIQRTQNTRQAASSTAGNSYRAGKDLRYRQVRVLQGVGIAGATGEAGRGMEDWRKSSYSGANGGSCVETASGTGMILIRDTTDRDGFTLSVPAQAWAKFTATIKLARRRRLRLRVSYWCSGTCAVVASGVAGVAGADLCRRVRRRQLRRGARHGAARALCIHSHQSRYQRKQPPQPRLFIEHTC